MLWQEGFACRTQILKGILCIYQMQRDVPKRRYLTGSGWLVLEGTDKQCHPAYRKLSCALFFRIHIISYLVVLPNKQSITFKILQNFPVSFVANNCTFIET